MDKYIHDEKNGLWYERLLLFFSVISQNPRRSHCSCERRCQQLLRCLPCLYHSSVRRNFTQYSFEGIKGGKTLPGVRKWQSRSLD